MGYDTGYLPIEYDFGDGPIPNPSFQGMGPCRTYRQLSSDVGPARDRLRVYLRNRGDGDAAAQIDRILAHPLFAQGRNIDQQSVMWLFRRAQALGLVRI